MGTEEAIQLDSARNNKYYYIIIFIDITMAILY